MNIPALNFPGGRSHTTIRADLDTTEQEVGDSDAYRR